MELTKKKAIEERIDELYESYRRQKSFTES